jgi:hypothetical protein
MIKRVTSRRVLGILACAALSGLAAWKYLAPPARVEVAPTAGAAVTSAPGLPEGAAVVRKAAANPTRPDAHEIQARLVMAQVRRTLGQAWQRAASQGDFSLAPGSIVQSLLARRCGLVERHAEQLAGLKGRLEIQGTSSAELCRGLLFTHLKEQLSLPGDMSPEKFWSSLEQVDAAYKRIVLGDSAPAQDDAFFASVERFREARRGILGPELDRRIFGLSDDLLLLPAEVGALARASETSVDQKLATWHERIQRLEREHGIKLADVVEPMTLARHELSLRETTGPVTPDERQAVLERYAGTEAARRHLEHAQQQQQRGERLNAFNAERERLLGELARAGLTPEQLRQRMPEIDQHLLEKYHLQ